MLTEDGQQMLILNTKDMLNVFKGRMKVLTEFMSKVNGEGQEDKTHEKPNISADYLQNSKWPTRLLSLVHPFTLDENLDENLELFFGLSVPFLDFRIGVQGIDESFSFVIDRDDKDKDTKIGDNLSDSNSNQHYGEAIKFLKQKETFESQSTYLNFINQEFWKSSPYMNTVIISFFLSTLVAIVEFA